MLQAVRSDRTPTVQDKSDNVVSGSAAAPGSVVVDRVDATDRQAQSSLILARRPAAAKTIFLDVSVDGAERTRIQILPWYDKVPLHCDCFYHHFFRDSGKCQRPSITQSNN